MLVLVFFPGKISYIWPLKINITQAAYSCLQQASTAQWWISELTHIKIHCSAVEPIIWFCTGIEWFLHPSTIGVMKKLVNVRHYKGPHRWPFIRRRAVDSLIGSFTRISNDIPGSPKSIRYPWISEPSQIKREVFSLKRIFRSYFNVLRSYI